MRLTIFWEKQTIVVIIHRRGNWRLEMFNDWIHGHIVSDWGCIETALLDPNLALRSHKAHSLILIIFKWCCFYCMPQLSSLFSISFYGLTLSNGYFQGKVNFLLKYATVVTWFSFFFFLATSTSHFPKACQYENNGTLILEMIEEERLHMNKKYANIFTKSIPLPLLSWWNAESAHLWQLWLLVQAYFIITLWDLLKGPTDVFCFLA